MTTHTSQDYSQYCNSIAMKLYEATALVNAIGTMAEHHSEDHETPQSAMIDIELITRNIRRIIYAVTDDLDRNSTKYQLITESASSSLHEVTNNLMKV